MQKQFFFTAMLFLASFYAQAQYIQVEQVEYIKFNDKVQGFYPRFSPVGDYIVFSNVNYAGLSSFDLNTRKLTELTNDLGAGYNTQISADGKTILYNKIELVKNMRQNSLVQIDKASKQKVALTAPSRDAVAARFAANKPMFVSSQKKQARGIKTNQQKPIISIEDRKMVLYRGSSRMVLTPNGSHESYIWPSISPDGTKIAYTVVGKNTFVCNIDGTDPVYLGYLNAPKWLTNKWVIGMDDKEDGVNLISSDLIAVDVRGKIRQQIASPAGKKVLYPAPSADGKRIVFNTEKGEIFMLTVNIK